MRNFSVHNPTVLMYKTRTWTK